MLAVTALSILVSGYHFGSIDQSHYLPYLKYFMDPGLYDHDLLLETIPGQHPLFWRALASVAMVVPPETLFLGLHLVVTTLATIAVYALGLSLFRDRTSAAFGLLVVALSVPGRYFPGADPLRLAWPELTLRSLAFPGLLFALVLALHQRPLWAMALAGLMANIHPISAVVVGAMVWSAGMVVQRRPPRLGVRGGACPQAPHTERCGGRGRPPPRLAWAGPVVFLLCAAPMVADFLRAGASPPLSASELGRWLALSRMRSGPHLFPSVWPLGCWVGATAVLAVSARSLLFMRPWTERDRMAMVFGGVAIALWLPATLFSEVWPVRLIIMAQLFRASKLAVLVALLYYAHHQRMRFAGHPREVAAGVLAVAAFLALRLEARLIVVLALGAAHFLPTLRVPDGRARSKLPVMAALGLLVVVLAGAARLECVRRVGDGLPWWGGLSPAWQDVQLWCRDHTPRDAVLLTPPAVQGFRCFSERAIVADYKDGAPHGFNPPSLFEWWRRMRDMEIEPQGWTCSDARFQRFGEAKMAWLCGRYGATYVVVRSSHVLRWRKLYGNGSYSVYETPPDHRRHETDEGAGGGGQSP